MSADVLSSCQLNRATLERQLLLQRSTMPAIAAVDHLVGMQAQVPLNPYLGMWSRLDAFEPADLAARILDRSLVRIVVMRGTLHLVTADDCLLLRPLVQPVLDDELARHSEYKAFLHGLDLEPVMAFIRPLLEQVPRTGTELRALLAVEFPEQHAAALAYACRNKLAFVQVPPRGVWGKAGQVRSTTAESYLGRPLVNHPSIDEVALRYFAAFGPASVADLTAWSRLTGLREVVERIAPQLRTFHDERGRELFDLPDVPRPDPDLPAPPRDLPEYDNLLLSHADRTRFGTDEQRQGLGFGNRPVHGTVLVDGSVRATWHCQMDKADGLATLTVSHLPRLTKRDASAVAAEGRRMVRFLHDDAGRHDVILVALD